MGAGVRRADRERRGHCEPVRVYARITRGYHHEAVQYPYPPQPADGATHAPRRPDPLAGARRALGPVAVVAAAVGKYGLVLLKVGKFGPTLISFALTIGVMALRFGWAFGVGIVALIAVHESGHLLFARREGIKAGAPIFLGPFGAVIGLKQPPKDARQEAVIAIGGPVVGTMGAIVALVLSAAAGDGTSMHDLLLALAYVGFLLNLFNLIPFSPLDGGRVASALSPWTNVVGLGIVILLILGPVAAGGTFNPILLLILIIGGISVWQRFKRRGLNPGYERISARTRLWIGLAYAAMLAITAIGMSQAHAALAATTSTIQ
jgi:Zn-dependent protease